MPKMVFDIGMDNADEVSLENMPSYDEAKLGIPPKGIYKFDMRRLRVKKNNSGNLMLTCVNEIAEPDEVDGKSNPKAKYNGYSIWWNGNIQKESVPYLNAFLDSLSGGDPRIRAAFWDKSGKVRADKVEGGKAGDDEKIIKAIGHLKIKEDGMFVYAETRMGKNYKTDADELQINKFILPPPDVNANPQDEDEPDDEPDDEPQVTDVSSSATSDEDSDSSDESSDDDSPDEPDDDNDDEPPF